MRKDPAPAPRPAPRPEDPRGDEPNRRCSVLLHVLTLLLYIFLGGEL